METVNRGSVTVFFSLVFLLILSLIGTLVEVTRFQVTKGHTSRTLESAADALFTEYNRPLYEQYRLFLIENEGEPFAKTMASYMNDTLNPMKGKTIDFLSGSLIELTVPQMQFAGDDGGKAIDSEVRRFMSRKLAKDAVQTFLADKKGLEQIEPEAETLKNEVEEEKEAAKLDVDTLELMKLVDGVICEDGDIEIADCFAKKIIATEIKASSVGIDNSYVWEHLSGEVISLDEVLNQEGESKKEFEKLYDVTKEAIDCAVNLSEEYEKLDKSSTALSDYYENMDELINGNDTKKGIEEILRGNLQVLKEVIEILEKDWEEDTEEQITTLFQNYEVSQICFDYMGIEEEGGADDPKESLSSLLDDGILKLVMKKSKKCSTKEVKDADCFSHLYGEGTKEETNYSEKIDDFAEDDSADFTNTLGDFGSAVQSEFCMDKYIQNFFGTLSQSVGTAKKALQYEIEYIICGKESDRDNLAGVAERLLLLRSLANTGTICSSSKFRKEAYALAASIVGFSGMEPLIRLTQTLILITWGMEEGLVDVAALFQGKKVPIVKKVSQITVHASELLMISRKMIQKKAKAMKDTKFSMEYEDYLVTFLLAMNNNLKRYRVMDLIEWNVNMSSKHEFHLANCVYRIQAKAVVQYQSRFFRMPMVERMLGRSLKTYSHQSTIYKDY